MFKITMRGRTADGNIQVDTDWEVTEKIAKEIFDFIQSTFDRDGK